MSMKLPKNLLPALLGIVAIAVWGNTAYRFMKGVSAEDDIPANNYDFKLDWNVAAEDSSQESGWTFKPDYRDPFRSWLPAARKKKTVAEKPEPKKNNRRRRVSNRRRSRTQDSNLKLIGIIRDDRGTLAVVEDKQNQTWFVRVGDTINELKITEVTLSELKYKQNGKDFTLSLAKN